MMSSRLMLLMALTGLLLAVPSLLVERSLKRLLRAFISTAFGVLVPLMVFFASVLAIPDWKGECAHGWWDCFHLGKLALTPLVLWASLALYLVEVGGPLVTRSQVLTLA